MKKLIKYYQLKHNFKTMAPPKRKPLPAWMEERIIEDVSHADYFHDDGLYNRDLFLFCRIRNSKIRFRHIFNQYRNRRLHILKIFLNFLAAHYRLPDLDFAIYYCDSLEATPSWVGMPTLCFAKRSKSKGPILIPDFEMLKGYDKLESSIEDIPWKEKKNIAFWRGSTSGVALLSTENCQKLPRFQLTSLSCKYPEQVNARFHSIVQSTKEAADLIQNQGMLGTFTSISNHLHFKYLVDVDGNSCTYSRLYWILYSNCVPLKQISPNVQWYYGGLKDLENVCFFSLDREESLITKLNYLSQHDEVARDIANKGRSFCREFLNRQYTTNYMLSVLDAIKETYK